MELSQDLWITLLSRSGRTGSLLIVPSFEHAKIGRYLGLANRQLPALVVTLWGGNSIVEFFGTQWETALRGYAENHALV